MATGTTVFSRVTVVAPRTRIDLALPADVSVADLLPMLLDRAREATADGGARHGGWCLARLGDAPLDPSRTLASLGVVDGDMLQLRRRSDNPPPPLYDDIVDAVAEAEPGSYRPWTKQTAARIGHVAGGLGLLFAASALALAGRHTGFQWAGLYGIAAAAAAGIMAVLTVGVGAVVTRAYAAPRTGVVIAGAGGLPMAFVCGLCTVPDNGLRAPLLLAFALALILATVSIMVIGAGIIAFIAAATAAAFGTAGALVALLLDTVPPASIAAGTAAVALAGISILPRVTIQLSKLPLPHVPGNAEDLKDDSGFPDYRVIERRAGLAHQYMTGLIIGCGATGAVSAVIAASADTVFGPILAAVVAAVLLLRGRNYANGSQAIALLLSGLAASAGLTAGWLHFADPMARLLWLFPTLLVLGAAGVVFGVVFPNRRFSPVLRRTVDIVEAVLIATVLPLALGAMHLYEAVRHSPFLT